MALLHYFCLLTAACLLLAASTHGAVIQKPSQADRLHLDDRISSTFPRSESQPNHADELQSSYWLNAAADFVRQRNATMPNRQRAKNIILFLGDGMSVSTVSAARVYLGGEESRLSFESFPDRAMVRTYCADMQVADSACTGTAYLNGVKANYGTIGVTAKVRRGDCAASGRQEYWTESLAGWSMAAGKSAGVVTTTRVTHASPASVYAHSVDRDWEADVDHRCSNEHGVRDIAQQMVEPGSIGARLNVVLGGGRHKFFDQSIVDQAGEPAGHRQDGRNLIDEWLRLDTTSSSLYVTNRMELLGVDASQTDRLIGLFADDHCAYRLDIDEATAAREPTLSEMVAKAIEVLATNEQGFFLFVEGGRIDMAHHDSMARRALNETTEFAEAIALARNLLSDEDTLIVTTADHSHTMSYAGYSDRGGNIFGSAGISDLDHMPYMTLSYANGPGFSNHMNATTSERINPMVLRTTADAQFLSPATLPLPLETHGGDDVAIYASGPWSQLFGGNVEQHFIPYAMAYAACVGDGPTACS